MQPVIELSTGRPVGAEALVRWRHPYAGVLEPKEFLGAAEETGRPAPLEAGRVRGRTPGAQSDLAPG